MLRDSNDTTTKTKVCLELGTKIQAIGKPFPEKSVRRGVLPHSWDIFNEIGVGGIHCKKSDFFSFMQIFVDQRNLGHLTSCRLVEILADDMLMPIGKQGYANLS